MTRDMDTVKMSYEEMIDTLKGLVFGTFDRTTVKEREALDMAIKALEQDSILDKIRKDVESLPKTYPFVNHFDMYVKVIDVEKIIDKYKAGMESEE